MSFASTRGTSPAWLEGVRETLEEFVTTEARVAATVHAAPDGTRD